MLLHQRSSHVYTEYRVSLFLFFSRLSTCTVFKKKKKHKIKTTCELSMDRNPYVLAYNLRPTSYRKREVDGSKSKIYNIKKKKERNRTLKPGVTLCVQICSYITQVKSGESIVYFKVRDMTERVKCKRIVKESGGKYYFYLNEI